MSFTAIGLCFNQDCAAALTCKFHGMLRDLVTTHYVISVDDVSGNSITGSLLRKVSNGRLQTRWRRICVMVVFRHDNQRQSLYRSEVEAFVKRARTHSTIANVRQSHDVLLLHSRTKKNPGHNRDHVAEMRDWTNEAFLHIAEMDV